MASLEIGNATKRNEYRCRGKSQVKKRQNARTPYPSRTPKQNKKEKSNDNPYVPHVYVKKSEQQSINQCLISTGLRNYVPVELTRHDARKVQT